MLLHFYRRDLHFNGRRLEFPSEFVISNDIMLGVSIITGFRFKFHSNERELTKRKRIMVEELGDRNGFL
jgi:hypothetical protein